MTDISIQFHALPTELRQFVEEMKDLFPLHLTAERYFPSEYRQLTCLEDLDKVFSDDSPYRRLYFTLDRPKIPNSRSVGFSKMNPEHMRLEIGQRTSEGLEQSWLTARTEDPEILSTWRKIANQLRKKTEAGVLAINRNSGASAPFPSFRCTEGALRSFVDSVEMLPPQGAGGPRLILGRGKKRKK